MMKDSRENSNKALRDFASKPRREKYSYSIEIDFIEGALTRRPSHRKSFLLTLDEYLGYREDDRKFEIVMYAVTKGFDEKYRTISEFAKLKELDRPNG